MQYLCRSKKLNGFRPLCVNTVILVSTLLQLSISSCTSQKLVMVSGDDGVDVVGFGEDCSKDGPFCDEERHLVCDQEEEVCVCDIKNGYIDMREVPGGLEQFADLERDANGNQIYNMKGYVCISKEEIIKRTDELMGLASKNAYPYSEESLSQENSYEIIEEEIPDQIPSLNEEVDPSAKSVDSMSILEQFLESGMLEVPDYDEKRLERFKIRNRGLYKHFTENEVIIKEILKYRQDPLVNLDVLKELLRERLEMNYKWRNKKLSNSICSLAFDIDQDQLFTVQEYVIALFSQKVRNFILPKVFLNLIGPLLEHSCISRKDLEALKHDPRTIQKDFEFLDGNGDKCISYEDFTLYTHRTCRVSWLTDFLRDAEIEEYVDLIDPTVDEMYIRWILQNERLVATLDAMDEDKDGFISYDELNADLLLPDNYKTSDRRPETDKLMGHLDTNQDGVISVEEFKKQISRPQVTDEFEYEWLETLCELYETDEEEVKAYLKIIQEDNKIFVGNEKPLAITNNRRIFEIFDKSRNGELDQVEFKIMTDTMQKFLLFEILNNTIDSMDTDGDRKLSVFEFYNYFNNISSALSIYLKNLLALESVLLDQVEFERGEGEESSVDLDMTRYYEAMEDEEEEMEQEADGEDKPIEIPSTKLLNIAVNSNQTFMIRRLFKRFDSNSDGFLTSEDLYAHASSYKTRKLPSELKTEFDSMDTNKDGLLTAEDAEEFEIPIDFVTFQEVWSIFDGEVMPEQRIKRFAVLDANKDGAIQPSEFLLADEILFANGNDEKLFLDWLEHFLGSIPTYSDKDTEKAFAEFDTNCDRFISLDEFKRKVDNLRVKMEDKELSWTLKQNGSFYFTNLDLNKDNKVSMNEFQIILFKSSIKHDDRSL